MTCLQHVSSRFIEKLLVNLKTQCAIRTMSNQNLREIFLKSVEAVKPENLIKNKLRLDERHLYINDLSFSLGNSCYMVGFGKAVLGMALQLEKLLGDRLKRATVTVPVGIIEEGNSEVRRSKINFIEGAKNNIPDERALRGAIEIKNLVEGLSNDDLLVVLISGGGSALLPLPKPPITLEEKQELIRNLGSKGADIVELNCVRKKISILKGGGLAELAYPARVVSLILSDVVSDPLDFIASGPTVPNTDRPDDALNVVKKYGPRYGLYDGLPESIRIVLLERDEDEKKRVEIGPSLIEAGRYKHVENIIIGNNRMAAEAAKHHAISLGFQSAIISTTITGNVSKISKFYARLARDVISVICNSSSITAPTTASAGLCSTSGSSTNFHQQKLELFLREGEPGLHVEEREVKGMMDLDFTRLAAKGAGGGVCLIGAGETTVEVRGKGKGGRNQQLALEFSLELDKQLRELSPAHGSTLPVEVSFLSCGTDGMDGPTDAAGAVGTPDLLRDYYYYDSRKQKESQEDEGNATRTVEEYLADNDSYGFYERFENGEYLVKTGHTGTNVMDIHLLCFQPKCTL